MRWLLYYVKQVNRNRVYFVFLLDFTFGRKLLIYIYIPYFVVDNENEEN